MSKAPLALSMALAISALSFSAASAEAIRAQSQNTKLEETICMESDKTQPDDGKKYQITRTIIKASPEDVFNVIVDYKNAGRLFSNLKKSDVVSRDEDSKTSTVSFSLKGIMNLFSFDYVLAIKENFPSSIEFKRVSGAFKRNEGYWKLLPMDSGRATEVVYAKYIDAGIGMPPQLVAKQVKDSTADVVANLKLVAENPKIASHR